MSVKPVPETANRQDWARLVAAKARDHDARLAAAEAMTRAKARFLYG